MVKAVVGKVSHRLKEGEEFKTTKAGDMLTEGTVVRTALRSQVQIQVGTGQVLTLDRMGQVVLKEAIATGGKEKTSVDLPYGRVKFEVSSTRVANDVKIAAPDATLAVKGTLGLMEVAAGFPTLAYGDRNNDGVFTVGYKSGPTVAVARQEGTDAKTPDPAGNANQNLLVDIGDYNVREGDEFGFIFDFPTLYEIAFGGLQGPGVALVPPATGLFAVDEDTGDIIQYDINDPVHSILVNRGAGYGSGANFVGAATRASSRPGGGTEFLRLIDTGQGADLLSVDLGRGLAGFTRVASFDAQGDRLEGLGALDGQLYSARSGEFGDAIVRLDAQTGMMTPVGDLGIAFEGGLSGFTPRGTLLISGRLPFITGASRGILGDNAVIMEFDPRTNYVRSVFSDLTGDFAPDAFDSIVDPAVDPSLNSVVGERVEGLGRFSVVLGGGVGLGQDAFAFLVNYTASINGTPTTVVALLNPLASRQIGDPSVLLVGPTQRNIRDFSGETAGAAAPSVALSPPPSQIDTSLPQLFRELAYSTQALQSGVLNRLVASQVVNTARNPSGCQQSTELTSLPTFLGAHVNQRSGVGGAVADFRNALPPNHPCLRPLGP